MFSEDHCGRLAAMLAYYAAFALAPLLVIAVAIVGATLGGENAEVFTRRTEEVLGPRLGPLLLSSIGSFTSARSLLAGVIGFVVLLFTASSLFLALQFAFDHIRGEPPPARHGLLGRIRPFLGAFVITGVGAIAIVGSFIVSATVMGAVAAFGTPRWIHETVNTVVTWALATVVLSVIYVRLPTQTGQWGHAVPGAAFATALMILTKWGFAYYVAVLSRASALAAAGSPTLLLLSLYLAAESILLGFEVSRAAAAAPPSDATT